MAILKDGFLNYYSLYGVLKKLEPQIEIFTGF